MAALLFVAFIVVPIVELWLIAQVADLISWPITIVLLIAEAIIGAWLVKREGRSTWRRFSEAISSRNRVPAVEVVDGALVIIGGTLLLTPGFLTDIVAFVCIVPPTRAVANRIVRSRVRGRFGLGGRTGAGMTGGRPGGRGRPDDPATIDVEVIDIQSNGTGPAER